MFSSLKIIAAELKRANDLKERDIENKERCNWYYQMNYHPPEKPSVTHQSISGYLHDWVK